MNKNTLKREDVEKVIEKFGGKLIGEYLGSNHNITVMCSCGHLRVVKFSVFKRPYPRDSHLCKNCAPKRQPTPKKEMIERFEKEGFFVLNKEEVWGTNDKVNLIDNNGYKYYTSLNYIYQNINDGSVKCSPFYQNNPHTHDNICLWISKNNKTYTIGCFEYVSSKTRNIPLTCNICKNIWNTNWDKIQSGRRCPYCSGKMVTLENSFGSNYPELLKDWDYELNLDSPFSYSSQSGKKVYWKCQKCAYKWEAVLASRVKGNGCSMCSGKIITSKNNLGDAFPELLKEWNYEKNIKSPFSYFSHSGKKVWWKCLKCGQEWDDVIYHRTDKNKMSGCPFCAGKRVSKENSLGSLYPELLLDWDYIKNSKSPYEYTAHSDKYIFWICHVCGYSWETMIDGRTRKEAGCPQCSWNNRKSAGMEEIKRRFSEKGFSIISNYNVKRVFDVVDIMDKDGYKYRTTLNSVSDHRKGSLEKFYKNSPFLFDNMLLWVKLNDADFDLLSYEITNNKKSTKVKLSCHECGDVWETNWNAVTSSKLGCPNCASSKGNKFIKKYLLKNGVDVIPEYRFTDCKGIKNRPMPFDFYLPDLNIAIEYQGKQHYFPVNFGGITDDRAREQFEELQIRDSIKEQYCLDNNIPLLKIHYKDFDRIPEILTEYLNL